MPDSISVLIPTRLSAMPDRPGELWLQRAIRSVGSQSVCGKRPIEIVVGLDHGAAPPDLRVPEGVAVRCVETPATRPRGQAAAINSAASAATGTLIAILEDDDAWHTAFLQHAIQALKSFDFVSSSQILVDQHGLPREPMYFPTPSGWLMRRQLWQEMGGFDETIRFHVDMEWLGRLNQTERRRAHLVERGFPIDLAFLRVHRKWLAHIAEGQARPVKLVQHKEPVPLVVRTLSPGSGTNLIRNDPDAAKESRRERAAFRKRFGALPW